MKRICCSLTGLLRNCMFYIDYRTQYKNPHIAEAIGIICLIISIFMLAR